MKGTVFLLSLAIAASAHGQTKPGLLGFAAGAADFIGSHSKSGTYDPAFSLMYWKGITSRLDFSVRYNGIFSDYSKVPESNSQYLNEFEGSLHLRPITDDHVFSPFLSAGIGVGDYGGRWATYTPLGGGLQFKLGNEDYIFLQANYRVSLQSKNLDNNMFYSIGFTQSIGSVRKAPPVVMAPPPPPVMEVKDRDGDGVPDSLDACPDQAGPAKFNGCPDTDGDGILDKDDKCPNTPGVAKYQGCPIPDSDGDGINDEEDKCPNTPGVAKYQGCPIPDRDGDGVNDEIDKCPDIPGDPANQGCPIVKEEVKKKADYAAQHIYFATASYILLKRSFMGLDVIADLLKNDPGLKLSVDGYTDNTGKPEKNQVLSENRAASVKNYLLSKGIGEDRILSTGHGASDPIADNKTAPGRSKNRRVVLKLDYL